MARAITLFPAAVVSALMLVIKEFMACSTPVALILYNRPDLTARVFAAIRHARPRNLFLIADGPRVSADEPKCREARRVVSQVDWDCRVRQRFLESNRGCGHGPAGGLDWVFGQVETAIILEDDCLPAPSFFQFCETLLGRYRDDPRVMHISGNNYQLGRRFFSDSYYFSKYTHNCGWATWRRAWRHYDFELKGWPSFQRGGGLRRVCPDPVEAAFWRQKLQPIYEKKRADAWDFQWNFAVWAQGGLAILPAYNLITNLGFRPDATHTRQPDARANLPASDLWELQHPPSVAPDLEADRFTFDEILGGHRLRQRRTWRYRLAKPARLWRKFQTPPMKAFSAMLLRLRGENHYG